MLCVMVGMAACSVYTLLTGVTSVKRGVFAHAVQFSDNPLGFVLYVCSWGLPLLILVVAPVGFWVVGLVRAALRSFRNPSQTLSP